MKLDAECSCTSGPGAYPYVPESKVGELFTAWMAEHQTCRTRADPALSKNPNPLGQVSTEASPTPSGEASGPVGLGPHVWRPPILPKTDRQCGKCGCAESSAAATGPCRGTLPGDEQLDSAP